MSYPKIVLRGYGAAWRLPAHPTPQPVHVAGGEPYAAHPPTTSATAYTDRSGAVARGGVAYVAVALDHPEQTLRLVGGLVDLLRR